MTANHSETGKVMQSDSTNIEYVTNIYTRQRLSAPSPTKVSLCVRDTCETAELRGAAPRCSLLRRFQRNVDQLLRRNV